MITKLTSTKTVIAKIIADLDLKEDDIKITDIREWIAEGMEKIGAVTQLEPKVKTVEIHNHQAQIPCDLHQLIHLIVMDRGFQLEKPQAHLLYGIMTIAVVIVVIILGILRNVDMIVNVNTAIQI